MLRRVPTCADARAFFKKTFVYTTTKGFRHQTKHSIGVMAGTAAARGFLSRLHGGMQGHLKSHPASFMRHDKLPNEQLQQGGAKRVQAKRSTSQAAR